MEKSANFTTEEWSALSPDQQAEALRVEDAIYKFLADSKTIRYVESEGNKDALLNFLEGHNLEITHANLLFAYNTLTADGALELVPLAVPVVQAAPAPTQPPAPIPTAPSRPGPLAWRNGKAIELTNPRSL